MAVTLKDIAKRVNKSVTTVSRALHDYNDVAPETKEEVRKVATELGYSPSSYAQRLQKQRSETIGLILPTYGPRFSDPFFSELLAGVGNQAAEMEYDLLVSTRSPGEDELQAYQTAIQSRRVDGFVVVRTRQHDARINYLCELGVPFVAFGRVEGSCEFPYVDEDSEYGMQLIVEHLTEQGHQRFAFIGAPDELMFAKARLEGFHQGLREHSIQVHPSMIVDGDLTQSSGYRIARELLDRVPRPTAIVACNDLMAIGAISAAQEKGFVVGEDVAITGFDDTPLAEHSHPPLTTIHQPIYKIGRMVCEMLISLIQGETLDEEQILLQPSLVIRQSSCKNLEKIRM